jgi:hypothetical protein
MTKAEKRASDKFGAELKKFMKEMNALFPDLKKSKSKKAKSI